MASGYSVQGEARRVLLERLVNDPKLLFTPEVKAVCEKTEFVGYTKPWLPTPCKFTESISAISALAAAAAAVVAEERYGIRQDVTVDTDKASLFLFGIFLPHINGVPVMEASENVLAWVKETDKYEMRKPIHRASTNQYKCKDGHYYHVHSSMNAIPIMKMLGVPEQDVTLGEARKIYADKVAQWESEDLDRVENEEYRQAGVICYTPAEFFQTEHGRILSQEPLATITKLEGPRKPWPIARGSGYRPLEGIRVVDLSRAVAAPAVSKILAALGADVIKISCSRLPDTLMTLVDVNAGKRDVDIDLKTEEGKATFRRIVSGADVFVDGYRPHALEKLGFDSDTLRKINPSLIYVREDCYGWKGPWAHRSGWQQIADCLVGIAILQGEFLGLNEPIQPLLPNSDYQTGVLGSAIVIQALQHRTKADVTFNIDLGLAQYNIWLYRLGLHTEEQKQEILALHPDFKPRHTTDLPEIAGMLIKSLNKSRPDLINNEEFYDKISGKEWGEKREISIIGAPFHLSKSSLGFLVPSGRRGWSTDSPDWVSVA